MSSEKVREEFLSKLPPVSKDLHGGHVFTEEIFHLLDTFHLPLALINW